MIPKIVEVKGVVQQYWRMIKSKMKWRSLVLAQMKLRKSFNTKFW